MTFAQRYRWLFFLSAVGLLLIGIGVFANVCSLIKYNAVWTKYDQIQPGMKVAEVRAIMEADPAAELETMDQDWYWDIWIWQLGGYRIEVQFTQPDSPSPDGPPGAAGAGRVWRKDFRPKATFFRWSGLKGGWVYNEICLHRL